MDGNLNGRSLCGELAGMLNEHANYYKLHSAIFPSLQASIALTASLNTKRSNSAQWRWSRLLVMSTWKVQTHVFRDYPRCVCCIQKEKYCFCSRAYNHWVQAATFTHLDDSFCASQKPRQWYFVTRKFSATQGSTVHLGQSGCPSACHACVTKNDLNSLSYAFAHMPSHGLTSRAKLPFSQISSPSSAPANVDEPPPDITKKILEAQEHAVTSHLPHPPPPTRHFAMLLIN